jgi:hypothetical protein
MGPAPGPTARLHVDPPEGLRDRARAGHTSERFRHHVWTQVGYSDQLDVKAKAAELP